MIFFPFSQSWLLICFPFRNELIGKCHFFRIKVLGLWIHKEGTFYIYCGFVWRSFPTTQTPRLIYEDDEKKRLWQICNCVLEFIFPKLIASRARTRSTQSTICHYISNLTLNFSSFLFAFTLHCAVCLVSATNDCNNQQSNYLPQKLRNSMKENQI